MSADPIKQALAAGVASEEEYYGRRYLRVTDDARGLLRGTVLYQDELVYGYPHIGRILSLESGIREHFFAPFHVEEKVDGYNVRIFKSGDEMVVMTRGGFVCPFSCDRLPDLMPLAIFEKEPELIVCAEIAGPDNPYNEETPPRYQNELTLRIFDLMRKGESKFIPFAEKLKLSEEYELPLVRSWGLFNPNETERLHEVMAGLNDERSEGVVIKEAGKRNYRAKYITAAASLDDIAITSTFLCDMDPEYYTNRLLQTLLYLNEERIRVTPELERQLGAAFLRGMDEAIESYRSAHKVRRRFRSFFNQKKSAERMVETLKARHPHGAIVFKDIKRSEQRWLLEFDRIYPKTTGLFSFLFEGGVVFD